MSRSLRIAVAAVVVLGLLAAAAWWFLTGVDPLGEERACRDGEAPYVYAEGGSGCAEPGTELPRGAHWDPRGNHTID